MKESLVMALKFLSKNEDLAAENSVESLVIELKFLSKNEDLVADTSVE